MPDFFAPLLDWFTAHPQWLSAGVFLITLIECTALVGVIWPGVILLFGVALLAGQSDMALWPLALLAWLAAFAGNSGSFLLGARLQNGARTLPLLRTHPQWLVRAELHLERYGAASLLGGHFIGPVRPLLPLLAGMLNMPRRRFMAINLAVSGLWSFSAVLPGWLTGSALAGTTADPFKLHIILFAVALLALASCALWLGRTAHPQRHLLLALLSSLMLLALLGSWHGLQPFDLYLQQLGQLERSPTLDSVMLVATQLADIKLQILLNGLLCALLLLYRARWALVFSVLSLMSATLLNALLKLLVARPRPQLLNPPLDGYSMPSGHSVRSFAFFLVLAVLLGMGRRWQWRWIYVVLACLPASLVALSRVQLTAHWPTDTLAGALLAMASCAAALAVLEHPLLKARLQPSPAPLPPRFWLLQSSASLLFFILFVCGSLATAAAKYQLT